MIELGPEQRQALTQGAAPRTIDPWTQDAYVLFRADEFERLVGHRGNPRDSPYRGVRPGGSARCGRSGGSSNVRSSTWVDLESVPTGSPVGAMRGRPAAPAESDTVPVHGDAVRFGMVYDPEKAALDVQDDKTAVNRAEQTAPRDMIGRTPLAV